MVTTKISDQEQVYDVIYSDKNVSRFDFHVTTDRVIRYLRDRRLQKAISYLQLRFKDAVKDWKVLIVCGGVGGEGIFFLRAGFLDVTVSDFSSSSLSLASRFDNRLKTIKLNAESLELRDDEYDLVIVQDGLHHLPRPSLGLTEMLRVAKVGIVVIEPYKSVIGRLIGTEWENQSGTINYVFRWNGSLVRQTVKSYLLTHFNSIKIFRFWDHNVVVGRIARKFPSQVQLLVAKLVYRLLWAFNLFGNMMVAVIIKTKP